MKSRSGGSPEPIDRPTITEVFADGLEPLPTIHQDAGAGGLAAAPAAPGRAQFAGALIAVLAALAAEAHADPSYPTALEPQALRIWLVQATDVTPEQVVAVSPSAVTAVMARATTPVGAQLLLRAEAITPQAAARTGLLSWEMRLDVNCRSGQLRAGATNGYASRRPDGQPLAVAATRSDWRRPVPGTALEAAWRAVCDPRFRRPLAVVLRTAQTAPAGSAAPAAPPPRPPSLAPAAAEGPAAAHPTGSRVVQVVSSPVEGEARRRLDGLRSRFPERLAGLDVRIENAEVRGHTVYRGLVAGFASRADALAFCQSLKSRGQDCLAR